VSTGEFKGEPLAFSLSDITRTGGDRNGVVLRLSKSSHSYFRKRAGEMW